MSNPQYHASCSAMKLNGTLISELKYFYVSSILSSCPWFCPTLNADCNILNIQTEFLLHFYPRLLGSWGKFPRFYLHEASSFPSIKLWMGIRAGFPKSRLKFSSKERQREALPKICEGRPQSKGISNDKWKGHLWREVDVHPWAANITNKNARNNGRCSLARQDCQGTIPN